MSSAARRMARTAANHANARLSTGPVTEAGKAISSQNATKHGLTGKQVVIPGEDPAAYEELKRSLYREYQPKAKIEEILLEEFAACIWRLSRARHVETAFLRKLTEDAPDPDMAIAMAFLEKPAEMNRLQRYITSIERAYNRAMANLHNIVKARQQAEQQAVDSEVWSDPAGFVSQTEMSPAPDSHEEEQLPPEMVKAA